MSSLDEQITSSLLVRLAGLPIRYWLAAANPTLFAEVRRFARAEARYRGRGSRLADEIGRELVPRDDLGRADRAALLAVRRDLHRGAAVPSPDLAQVTSLVATLPGLTDRFRTEILSIVERDRRHAERAASTCLLIDAEVERLMQLPHIVRAESAVAQALPDLPPPVDEAVIERANRRERRRRAELVWRRIVRASIGTMPRDWLGHVALAPIATSVESTAPVASARFATHWVENLRTHRRGLATPAEGWPEPDSVITWNPLHWNEDGYLETIVLDHHAEASRARVRHTPLLDAVCGSLAAGPRLFREIAADDTIVAGDELRGFVRYLTSIGILQAGGAPAERLCREVSPTWAVADGDGRLDVYRFTSGALDASRALGIQDAVMAAMRLFQVGQDDASSSTAERHRLPDGEWTFTEVLRTEMAPERHDRDAREVEHGWGQGRGGRLAEALHTQIERAADGAVVDVRAATLDALGANRSSLAWPVDCLVRLAGVGAQFDGVLDQVWPAGVLDARFAYALRELHGAVAHEEFYRAFLRRLEARTGVIFVEVLTPPLADGAANAIRRPSYTTAWTGDPLLDSYFGPGSRPSRYIPFDTIRIRRVDGRLCADVDGQPIWPIHHATRSVSPPGDRVARVLLATAPDVLPWGYRRGHDVLSMFPDRWAVPRITIGGRLIVSPAQWRLDASDGWDVDDPLLSKITSLDRLRARLGLPRWISVAPTSGEATTSCDLESLHAIRAFERALGSGPVVATEIVPAPDQLLVVDSAGDPMEAQVQLRLPLDEGPDAMAERLAPLVHAATQGVSRRQPRPPVRRARDPPPASLPVVLSSR
jgi:hypothetical protein